MDDPFALTPGPVGNAGPLDPMPMSPLSVTSPPPAQPRRDPMDMLWAGTILDIGSFLASGGQSAPRGLGPQMMMQTQQYNAGIDQEELARQQAELDRQTEERRWRDEMALKEKEAGVTAGGRKNVQSSFRGQDGNMWVVLRDGSTRNTNVPYQSNFHYETLPDGSVAAISNVTGTVAGYPVTPEQAAAATTRETRLVQQLDALANLPKEERKAEDQLRSIDNVLGTVDEALDLVSPWTTGLVGAVTGEIPGTKAQTLRRVVETLQANLGFSQLQAMRDASPTGGALGQVSERELGFLQATLTSLDPSMSQDVLIQHLQKVATHYRNWQNAVNEWKAGAQERAGVGSPPSATTPAITGIEPVGD